MLYGPIYLVLVKELWANATVDDIIQDPSIQYNVFGFPITVTTFVLAKAIKCNYNGAVHDSFSFDFLHLLHFLHKIFKDPSDTNHASNLFSEAYIWHQVLSSNFNLVVKYDDFVTSSDKILLLQLNSETKVNLPLIIFHHMGMTLSCLKK